MACPYRLVMCRSGPRRQCPADLRSVAQSRRDRVHHQPRTNCAHPAPAAAQGRKSSVHKYRCHDTHQVDPNLVEQPGIQALLGDSGHGRPSPAAAPACRTALSTPSVTKVNGTGASSRGHPSGTAWVTTKTGTQTAARSGPPRHRCHTRRTAARPGRRGRRRSRPAMAARSKTRRKWTRPSAGPSLRRGPHLGAANPDCRGKSAGAVALSSGSALKGDFGPYRRPRARCLVSGGL